MFFGYDRNWGGGVVSSCQELQGTACSCKIFGKNLLTGIRVGPTLNGGSAVCEAGHRLGDPGNGVPPRLFIHERCARLIECLPSLQHDPNRPEVVLKVDADSQ